MVIQTQTPKPRAFATKRAALQSQYDQLEGLEFWRATKVIMACIAILGCVVLFLVTHALNVSTQTSIMECLVALGIEIVFGYRLIRRLAAYIHFGAPVYKKNPRNDLGIIAATVITTVAVIVLAFYIAGVLMSNYYG